MDIKVIENVYRAYETGLMNDQERMDYESDVKSGTMQLPPGKSLAGVSTESGVSGGNKSPAQNQSVPFLDLGIIDAYESGNMTREEKIQLEEDVARGAWQLPPNVQLDETKPLGFFGKIKEMFTGSDRTTPEIEDMPEWTGMPELNSLSFNSFKSAIGTTFTDPNETVQIIKANFPDVDIRRDAKGNFIIKSAMDGMDYAIKPGFTVGDIGRFGAGVAAFTPAGRSATLFGAGTGAGATQAVIEGSQAAAGGNFDPEQIPIAGAFGAGGLLLGRAAGSLGRQYERFTKGTPSRSGIVDPPSPSGASGASGASGPSPSEDISKTIRLASEGGLGSNAAKKALASQSMPDEKVVEAAKRIGVEDYLQPDHVSSNIAFREVFQAIKSIPGSITRMTELEGLEQVAKKADDIILEIGGDLDLSRVNQKVFEELDSIQAKLDTEAGKLFGKVKESVGSKERVEAKLTTDWINDRIDELGGKQYLSSLEKQVLSKISSKSGELPTYARIDDLRKALTSARVKKEGVFKDSDSGLIKKLEKKLLEDQRVAVESIGSADTLEVFNLARKTVAIRKGVEDDLKAIFGKNLDRTMVKSLTGSIKDLPSGDIGKFINLIKSVPASMREEVTASGLAAAFGKNARNGDLNFSSYANWYEGLLRNKKAHASLMANLPKGARKRLSDLYRVSNGIRKATRERITTGRIQAVSQEIQGTDTLMTRVYDMARRSAGGAAAEALTVPLGIPGAGLAAGLSAAFVKGQTNILRAADEVISSPSFLQMASNPSLINAKKLAGSSSWKKFQDLASKYEPMPDPARWILSSYQSKRQTGESK